eukprot:scaffold104872_cov24-Attheya_sp.AAC.1
MFGITGPFMDASMWLLPSGGAGIFTECSDNFYSERQSCRWESCGKVVPKWVLAAWRRYASVLS